jgi:plasmid stability protein
MRKQYDFSGGKRGAVIASPGRTPITLTLDDAVIEHFRARAEAEGTGYQDLINDILRAAVAAEARRGGDDAPLTVGTLRRVLREELHTP